jgi:hypothetical protein
MIWLKAILFFVLSPGVLLTLPPGSRGVFASRQTSVLAAAVHAIVFAVAAQFLWSWYSTGKMEYFADFQMCASDADCKEPNMGCNQSFCKPRVTYPSA